MVATLVLMDRPFGNRHTGFTQEQTNVCTYTRVRTKRNEWADGQTDRQRNAEWRNRYIEGCAKYVYSRHV